MFATTAALSVDDAAKKQLESLARSGTTPQRVAQMPGDSAGPRRDIESLDRLHTGLQGRISQGALERVHGHAPSAWPVKEATCMTHRRFKQKNVYSMDWMPEANAQGRFTA